MAMCDYYLCDLCGQKCFYDAAIAEYDDDNNYLLSGSKVDIAAICESCAKTHKCVVVKKEEGATLPAGEKPAFTGETLAERWAREDEERHGDH